MGAWAATAWTVLVPLRTGLAAKTRLAAPVPLVEAMIADCLNAVLQCDEVDRVLAVVSGPAPTVPDQVHMLPQVGQGLSAALATGLAELDDDSPVAILLPDRPCLTPGQLAAFLAAARCSLPKACFVPDSSGLGTAILAGLAGQLIPQFGTDSAARHLATGVGEIGDQAEGLRRDVDTPADLLAAWRLGVGPATSTKLADVQVTVLSYDPTLGSGDVVTDDGIRLALPAEALAGSGLRFVRPGQRLTALASPDDSGKPVLLAVRLNGIGDPFPT